VLACPAWSWRALAFSAGGDGGGKSPDHLAPIRTRRALRLGRARRFVVDVHGIDKWQSKKCRPLLCLLLALQAPQGAYLIALHRMNARRPALAPADVQTAAVQLDLVPLQIAQLGGA
jgi:hypothetical protein